MKILKQGNKPAYDKKFHCEKCGCIFIAGKSEYQASGQMEVMHDNLGSYKCKCPCCRNTVYQS